LVAIPLKIRAEIQSKVDPLEYDYALAEAAFLKACHPATDYMIGSVPRPNAYSAEFYFRSRNGATFGVMLNNEDKTVATIFITTVYEPEKLAPRKQYLLALLNSKSKCDLKLVQAPELRGFRLGATSEAVLARFPGLEISDADEFGFSAIQLRLHDRDNAYFESSAPAQSIAMRGAYASIERSKFTGFENIARVNLQFMDGSLSLIQLGYDDSLKWNSLNEFVSRISEALSLTDGWQFPDNSTRVLDCNGFRVTATFENSWDKIPTLTITDVLAEQRFQMRKNEKSERQRREEENRKRVFRP